MTHFNTCDIPWHILELYYAIDGRQNRGNAGIIGSMQKENT